MGVACHASDPVKLHLVGSLAGMLLTGCPDPDDLVHDRMAAIRGATVHRVDMVDTTAYWEFLNDADAHAVVKSCLDWRWTGVYCSKRV